MPYRAMFSTIVTAALALAAITMWVWAVTPFLTKATEKIPATTQIVENASDGNLSTQPSTNPATQAAAASAAIPSHPTSHVRALPVDQMETLDASRQGSPERMFRGLVRGVLLLSFVLLCMLLLVGFAATFREWGRYGARRRATLMARTNQKTKYVDAWTLAGQRMKEEPDSSEGDGEPDSEPYG